MNKMDGYLGYCRATTGLSVTILNPPHYNTNSDKSNQSYFFNFKEPSSIFSSLTHQSFLSSFRKRIFAVLALKDTNDDQMIALLQECWNLIICPIPFEQMMLKYMSNYRPCKRFNLGEKFCFPQCLQISLFNSVIVRLVKI